MKQADLGLSLSTKRTHKREFLDGDKSGGAVVGGAVGTGLALRARRQEKPFAVDTLRCIHFTQHWFSLSEPAMEGI